jgi:hypothetical protein
MSFLVLFRPDRLYFHFSWLLPDGSKNVYSFRSKLSSTETHPYLLRHLKMTKYFIILFKHTCMKTGGIWVSSKLFSLCTADYIWDRNEQQIILLPCQTRRYNMKQGDIFNVVFLSIINIVFMVAGIFLNSVVIISLWRSRQLRKKLCYFMILVLCCVDLAVVTLTHPLLISSTIYYALEEINVVREVVRAATSYILFGFSMSALFTLNVERFLALTCPFFHQASVTKTRLLCFLAFVTIVIGRHWYISTRTELF